jgi:hypothetical protein
MSSKHIMQQAAPRNESDHLALSSDIGHAVTCGLEFKLPRVMGAIPEVPIPVPATSLLLPVPATSLLVPVGVK